MVTHRRGIGSHPMHLEDFSTGELLQNAAGWKAPPEITYPTQPAKAAMRRLCRQSCGVTAHTELDATCTGSRCRCDTCHGEQVWLGHKSQIPVSQQAGRPSGTHDPQSTRLRLRPRLRVKAKARAPLALPSAARPAPRSAVPANNPCGSPPLPLPARLSPVPPQPIRGQAPPRPASACARLPARPRLRKRLVQSAAGGAGPRGTAPSRGNLCLSERRAPPRCHRLPNRRRRGACPARRSQWARRGPLSGAGAAVAGAAAAGFEALPAGGAAGGEDGGGGVRLGPGPAGRGPGLVRTGTAPHRVHPDG